MITPAELEELQAGDRVVYRHYSGRLYHGTVINVIRLRNQFANASVCFDECVPGRFHSCGRMVEDGRGRYLYPKDADEWSLENPSVSLKASLRTLWSGALT